MESPAESPLSDRFWDIFTELPRNERQRFLQKLVTQLTPPECQQLARLLPGVHCYSLDILPNLPVELALHIFDYLEPIQLIRCRQVNKSWNQLLTNDGICGPVLRRHFPADASLQLNKASIYYGKSDRWALENTLSKRHFFRNIVSSDIHYTRVDRTAGFHPFLVHNRDCMIVWAPAVQLSTLKVAIPRAELEYDIVECGPLPDRSLPQSFQSTSEFILFYTRSDSGFVLDVQKSSFKLLKWPNAMYSKPLRVAGDGDLFVALYDKDIFIVNAKQGSYTVFDHETLGSRTEKSPDLRTVSVNADTRTYCLLGWPRGSEHLTLTEYCVDTNKPRSSTRIDFPPYEIPALQPGIQPRYPAGNHKCGPNIYRVYLQLGVSEDRSVVTVFSLLFDSVSKKILYQSMEICLRTKNAEWRPADDYFTIFTWEDTTYLFVGHDGTYQIPMPLREVSSLDRNDWVYTFHHPVSMKQGFVGKYGKQARQPDMLRFYSADTDANGRDYVRFAIERSGPKIYLVCCEFKGIHDWGAENWREETLCFRGCACKEAHTVGDERVNSEMRV